MSNDRMQRIISIMNAENMNATQFAEAIGIQRAAMSHILSGRNNPSAEVLAKIAERFETINPGWLLSGKGNMRTIHSNTGMNNIFDNQVVKENMDSIIEKYIDSETKIDNNSTPDYNSELNIQDEIFFTDRKQERARVNKPEIISKESEKEIITFKDKSVEEYGKEIIIYKDKPAKIIDKLLIFYSDKTFETFIPEKDKG